MFSSNLLQKIHVSPKMLKLFVFICWTSSLSLFLSCCSCWFLFFCTGFNVSGNPSLTFDFRLCHKAPSSLLFQLDSLFMGAVKAAPRRLFVWLRQKIALCHSAFVMTALFSTAICAQWVILTFLMFILYDYTLSGRRSFSWFYMRENCCDYEWRDCTRLTGWIHFSLRVSWVTLSKLTTCLMHVSHYVLWRTVTEKNQINCSINPNIGHNVCRTFV